MQLNQGLIGPSAYPLDLFLEGIITVELQGVVRLKREVDPRNQVPSFLQVPVAVRFSVHVCAL